MLRSMILTLVLTGSLFAQMPKSFYAWWSSPVVKDLNLTDTQRRQIRATVREYRPRLIDIRTEIGKAELDLENRFSHDPVDQAKATEAIDHLISARSDLTRTLAQMSLKLRTVLTEQQWQELQRRRPVRGQDRQPPNGSPEQE